MSEIDFDAPDGNSVKNGSITLYVNGILSPKDEINWNAMHQLLAE